MEIKKVPLFLDSVLHAENPLWQMEPEGIFGNLSKELFNMWFVLKIS